MGRAPCCDKANVKRGPWSPEEDAKLKEYIEKHGTGGNWIALPQKAGLRRCGKSCRLRWLNYLRPNIKHGEFSDDEDRIICTLFANIGSRWSIIAAQLPGRTDNDIKNYWNTKLKKKILMGSLSSSSSLMLPNPYNSSQYHKIRPPNYLSCMNNIYPSSSSISFLQSPSSSLAFKCTSNHTTNSYNYSTLATPARSTFTAGNYETLSNNIISSSNLLLNLQTQDGFVGPIQSLYQEKGLSPRIMFGGAAAGAASGSCSNSSDGSNKDQVEYHEQFMLFSNGGGNIIDGTNNIIPQEKQIHGVFNGGDQIPLDYSNSTLEEIKQLIISTNHVSCVNSNLNFFVDENKTTTEEEKVMMYY